MPNTLAYAAILLFPLVGLVLFRTMRTPQAVAWTVLLGYMFLPMKTGFDFALIPPINKDFMAPVVACLFALAYASSGQSKSWRVRRAAEKMSWTPRSGWARIPLILLLFGAFGTAVTNTDLVVIGGTVLPAMKIYDAFSLGAGALVAILPFILARRFLSTEDGVRVLVRIFIIAGVVYSALVLVEVRLSPQLHYWAYGFYQHSFVQQVRFGGFRPMVFMSHSLWVGLFLAMAFVMAVSVARRADGFRKPFWVGAVILLFIALVLSKTVGAVAIGVLVGLMAMFGLRTRALFAFLVALFVIAYPILRGADLTPMRQVQDLAANFSEERAASLGFRLDQEDALLSRANQRPLFGWGGWSRNRVIDADTGRDTSVTDSRWAITIGIGGWVRYIAEFGLVAFPVVLIWLRRRRLELTPEVMALTLALSANLLDMLLNGTLTPLTFLLAGAVFGYAERATPAAARRGRRRSGATRNRAQPGDMEQPA